MKIGFIGLGIMGTPMALHLANAGHQLFVHTRSQVPEAIQAAGAVRCDNAAGVAREAEVVFTMVPDTPDVEAVLFNENGVAHGLKDSAGAVRKVVVEYPQGWLAGDAVGKQAEWRVDPARAGLG
ncbi:MAG: NAD(P)-binding domain-containing protein, partial [Hydrogenophaga sp.]